MPEQHIHLGRWDEVGTVAGAIRTRVFVEEQGVPAELEWDAADADCWHAIATDAQGVPVGTGRLLPDGHIGRMAVLAEARGSGVGMAILQALIAQARILGYAEVVLHAQTHAEAFYRRAGFVREGEIFMEAGIEHITMRLALDGR
ncbi:GNAT family N-acetyltransferase [Imbroritus primus]|uniref:GNAT family N-acetyltransferase n=1 Tax=Imbroritus primus TaxID=3058603 RepID=A0ACD3SRI4_9BURK|nr:GNAT family N-acetyltransferase [Burkholderiaceae bacterium PBA]